MTAISWISTIGGDWSDGANWQGGVVPGLLDDAVMNLVDTETITISTVQFVHGVSFNDPATGPAFTPETSRVTAARRHR